MNANEETKVQCPKCHSTQIRAGQRGWAWLTGFIGSGKVVITCLACGNRFLPGAAAKAAKDAELERLADLRFAQEMGIRVTARNLPKAHQASAMAAQPEKKASPLHSGVAMDESGIPIYKI